MTQQNFSCPLFPVPCWGREGGVVGSKKAGASDGESAVGGRGKGASYGILSGVMVAAWNGGEDAVSYVPSVNWGRLAAAAKSCSEAGRPARERVELRKRGR
jgi:hypothetical protein